MSGLIIPGVTPRDMALAGLLQQHKAAVASFTPEQAEAVNRLILATMMVQVMCSPQAPPAEQHANAQAALLEVIRAEARGAKRVAPMWQRRSMADPAADLDPDHLVDIAHRPAGGAEGYEG